MTHSAEFRLFKNMGLYCCFFNNVGVNGAQNHSWFVVYLFKGMCPATAEYHVRWRQRFM